MRKSAGSNPFNTACDRNACEFVAGLESIIADLRYTVRNDQTFNTGAAGKSAVPDEPEAVRKRDA